MEDIDLMPTPKFREQRFPNSSWTRVYRDISEAKAMDQVWCCAVAFRKLIVFQPRQTQAGEPLLTEEGRDNQVVFLVDALSVITERSDQKLQETVILPIIYE